MNLETLAGNELDIKPPLRSLPAALDYSKVDSFDPLGAVRAELAGTGPSVSIVDLRQMLSAMRSEVQNIARQADKAGREPTAREAARLDTLLEMVKNGQAALELKSTELERRRSAARIAPDVRRHGGRLVADMFGQGAVHDGGFGSSREFFSLALGGLYDPRLVAASNTEGDGVGGGFTVPTQFLGNLLDSSLEAEIVRPRAMVVPMESNEATAPGWDTENNSEKLGGLKGQWLGEESSATNQEAKFRKIHLKTDKLAIYCAASNEVVSDGYQFDQTLERAMSEAISFDFDYAFLRGSGVGQPLGVLNCPSLVTVSKEGSQGAATIQYVNLAKMLARLHPACVGNSVWVANPTTIPQLLQLFVTDGTTSTHVPVLRENGAGGYTILTRPVIFTEKMPVLGTVGDIVLADFSQYVVGLRLAGAVERSQHVGWLQDQVHFRLILRATGKPKWSKAVTPRHGDTLSWAVALQTRS